jgi:hypothetical protein
MSQVNDWAGGDGAVGIKRWVGRMVCRSCLPSLQLTSPEFFRQILGRLIFARDISSLGPCFHVYNQRAPR